MSTILRALQKLEKEKESNRASGPTPVFSKPHSTAGGVAGWFLNPWTRRAATGVIVIILSATSFYFYRQSRINLPLRKARGPAIEKSAAADRVARKHPASPALPSIEKQGPGQAAVDKPSRSGRLSPALPPPADKSISKVPGGQPNLQQADRPPTAATVEAQIQDRSFKAPKMPSAPVQAPTREVRRPRPAGVPAAEHPALPVGNGDHESPPANSAQESKIAAESKTPSDDYADTPQLTDGRLRVHAIAWSPHIRERMAVVNNRVIYEGDSVEGFVVVAIRPDDVVVREKQKGLWRVVFGRP